MGVSVDPHPCNSKGGAISGLNCCRQGRKYRLLNTVSALLTCLWERSIFRVEVLEEVFSGQSSGMILDGSVHVIQGAELYPG